jgi:flagellar assembly protein FliH
VTIQLEKPICSAVLLNDGAEQPKATLGGADEAAAANRQKESLSGACRALQDAVNKVNELQENIFKEHREQIVKLSVEIARKILAQKVQEGDYEIEGIVQESLKNVPKRGDAVVHLNPADLAECRKSEEGSVDSGLVGITLVADPHVGRGECLLETPKGIIESFIDEKIERLAEALRKAE